MAWYNPADPKQRNWMLGGLAFLVAIVLFRMYLLAPRQEANATLLTQVENLETVNRRASVLAAQGGGDLQERLALYEQHVAKLEELIPAGEEVPVLLDDISTRARIVDVDVTLLEPQPREPGALYDRTAYNMAVVGEYHSVGRFLADIASLSRIVTPIQVDIELHTDAARYPELSSPILATFQIETYVLPDSTAVPPPAAQPGA
ncbi:MAG: type 4a pilus biogenesis protein PilO [Longimicrobiales bacterium]